MEANNNIRKSLLEALLGSLSARERRMLLVLAMIANKKVKTRAEEELKNYSEEKRVSLNRHSRNLNLEKVMGTDRQEMQKLIDEVGRLNAMGLTRSQILKCMVESNEAGMRKLATSGKKSTYQPDVSKFTHYHCTKCGFTIDAVKDIGPDRECARCGAKPMVGLAIEDYHKKDNYKDFNEVTDENASKLPEPPRVKP